MNMKLTKKQMQEDIDFLFHRAMQAGSAYFGEDRFTGRSSNELVRLAYTGEHRGDDWMPRDYSDSAACARTWNMLPEHRQTDAVHKKMVEGADLVRTKYES